MIKTFVYNRLTTDAELQSYFPGGTVKAVNGWAESEETMPYIVYNADTRPVDTLDTVGEATLTFDIFDRGETQARMLDIRGRVNRLFEGVMYSEVNGTMRFRKAFDLEIREDDRYIWHNSSDWIVRYTRETEMSLLEG